MEIGAGKSQVACSRWQIKLMAEPELSPRRICSDIQAFVSAEQGRIVYFELQFIIPLTRKLFNKKNNAFMGLCHKIHLFVAISMRVLGVCVWGGGHILFIL